MAGYNGAWTGPQIDEAVRQVTNKDLPADGVKFADGQTFQQKYDAGQLTGPAGRDGTDGQDGTPGKDGAEGPAGPAGRGITGFTYSSATNKWTISYSDGSSEQVTGPSIPTQLSQLTEDASHRTVTDTEKSSWDAAADQAAAAMPKSGGTFTGTVKAGGASYESPTTYLLRNTRLASSDTTPTVNGEICWTYG